MLAQGPEVAAFEAEFAEHFGLGRACVAVNSGTSGLHLGLLRRGHRAGDEVIVPSFTFAATANSVALTGATPVFADIEPDDFCLDPAVGRGRDHRPHGGRSCRCTCTATRRRWTSCRRSPSEHGLQVFEDAAQAHGASLDGTPVGAFGSFAMFRLYPTKNMTSGEGGMVSVADAEIARLMRLLAQPGHGAAVRERGRRLQHPDDRHPRRDRPGAADEGRRLDRGSARRTRRSSSANLQGVVTPPVADGRRARLPPVHGPGRRGPRRLRRRRCKSEYDVGIGVYYPIPNHRLPPFTGARRRPAGDRAGGARGACRCRCTRR